MIWVIFAIAAPFLWAGMNVVDKLLREHHLKNSASLSAITGVLAFIPILIVSSFTGLTIPSIQILIGALMAGFLSRIAVIPYYEALSMEEASRVIPVFMVSPVFVLILSFLFLGEKLSINHYIAFILVFLGSVFITFRSIQGIFKPNKAFFLILSASLLFSIGDVLIKYAYGEQNLWNNLFWFSIGGLFGCSLLFLNKGARSDFKKVFVKPKSSLVKLLLLEELLVFLSTVFFFFAIIIGPISLVSVLGSGFQGLFILLFAVILSKYFPKILKEEIDKKAIAVKVIAIFLMLGGLLLIYL